MITFFIRGTPKGQPRPRAFAMKFGAKWQARVYNAKSAEGWKSEIANAAEKHIPAAPLPGPICLDIEFHFPRPKGHYRTGKHAGELRPDAPYFCTTKPDRDNADKAVLDTLTMLGFFADDAQVCDGRIIKCYADGSTGTGARIEISGAVRKEKA